jgi:hypothetical protein
MLPKPYALPAGATSRKAFWSHFQALPKASYSTFVISRSHRHPKIKTPTPKDERWNKSFFNLYQLGGRLFLKPFAIVEECLAAAARDVAFTE